MKIRLHGKTTIAELKRKVDSFLLGLVKKFIDIDNLNGFVLFVQDDAIYFGECETSKKELETCLSKNRKQAQAQPQAKQ